MTPQKLALLDIFWLMFLFDRVSFIHSFNKCLLSTSCASGIVLGTQDASANNFFSWAHILVEIGMDNRQ